MATKQQIDVIAQKARIMRHHIVDMISCTPGKVGHLGGSCSAADIVSALYFYKMNISAQNLNAPERDRFLLSKGHAALVQYAALAEMGVIPKDDLLQVKTLGSRLQGHPDKTKTPGVEANTGSLGQGLSIGLGLSLGQKLDGLGAKTYVLMGDGEQAEGQIWEAAMAAAAFKADNLIGILDRNRIQATTRVADTMDSGDLVAKWKAFGWHVIEIDGHDASQICDALDAADQVKGRPIIIIANTVKGKCVTFAENTAAYHNAGLTPEEFKRAHTDIDAYVC